MAGESGFVLFPAGVTDGSRSARGAEGCDNPVLCKQHVPPAFLLCSCPRSPSSLKEPRFSQQDGSVNLYLHHRRGCGSCIPHKIALMGTLNFWPALWLQATGGWNHLQECFRGCSVDLGLAKGTQRREWRTGASGVFRQEANFTVTLNCVNADWKWRLQHACLAIRGRISCWYLGFVVFILGTERCLQFSCRQEDHYLSHETFCCRGLERTKYHVLLLQPRGLKCAVAFQSDFFNIWKW